MVRESHRRALLKRGVRTLAITGSAPLIYDMKSQRYRGVRVHGVVSAKTHNDMGPV